MKIDVWVGLWFWLRRGRGDAGLAPGKRSVYLECQPYRLVMQVDLVRVAFGVDSTGAARQF